MDLGILPGAVTVLVTGIYPYRTAGLSSIKDVIDPAASLFPAKCLRWLHFCSVPDNGNMVIYARVMKTNCAQSFQLQNAVCPILAALSENFECIVLHIGTTSVFQQLNSFVHIIFECVRHFQSTVSRLACYKHVTVSLRALRRLKKSAYRYRLLLLPVPTKLQVLDFVRVLLRQLIQLFITYEQTTQCGQNPRGCYVRSSMF